MAVLDPKKQTVIDRLLAPDDRIIIGRDVDGVRAQMFTMEEG